MKSSPLCKIHRGVDKKEDILKNFQFIFIMLYDKSVHYWSLLVSLRVVVDFICLAIASPVYLISPNDDSAV